MAYLVASGTVGVGLVLLGRVNAAFPFLYLAVAGLGLLGLFYLVDRARGTESHGNIWDDR